jgi:hypothetical protein
LEKHDKGNSIPFYLSQLDNICFADYIDRITFQKQIWQFNEMSSLMKTFKNNKEYHAYKCHTDDKKNPSILRGPGGTGIGIGGKEIRFTKVLTKYSTEYNNSLFVQKLCQKLGMDKKDLFGFFIELSNNPNNTQLMSELDSFDITKLDVNRMFRYIEKYTKENACGTVDRDIEEDEHEDAEE